MSKLSTAAWVVHDLGLGACFGGQLFGRYAFNPKLRVIGSEADRGKLLNATWNRYNIVNAASLGIAAATWFAGRAAISGESVDGQARNLVLAKDALFASSAVVGLASIVSGLRLAGQAPEGAVRILSGTRPAPNTPKAAAGLLRTVNALGDVNLLLNAGIVTVSTILSMKANRSVRWSAVARRLP